MYLVLQPYHPDSLLLCQQGCEDPWVFCEAKGGGGGGEQKVCKTLACPHEVGSDF